jgi:hypothetical protein
MEVLMRTGLFGFGVLVFMVFFLLSPLVADHVNVPASAFKSGSSSFDALWNPLGGDYVYLGGTGSSTLCAPVFLPDGVMIKNMRVVYYDNDSGDDLHVELHRQNVFVPGTTLVVFEFSSSGATNAVQYAVDSTTPVPAKRKVQNGPVTWFIKAHFGDAGPSLRLYSVQIEYQ